MIRGWFLSTARTAAYVFRESLFALPAVIILFTLALAEIVAIIDRTVPIEILDRFTFAMTSNAAIWLLSIVGGATITTAGVVFSLTVVSLQLASSQFSPRVMRSFIRDRLSQTVVGLLVGTFVYCVLVLTNINGDPDTPAPRLSLTIAIVLTIVTVLLIIAHLNHLAQRLQVGQVVRSIAEEGQEVVVRLLRATQRERAIPMPATPDGTQEWVVTAARDGWVTQASSAYILGAVPPGTTVRLETRTGAYIHQGEPLVTVWPPPRSRGSVARRLRRTVEVKAARRMQEDVDFAIRQLVDVGLRALSAAVNDPNTAVEATLRIGSLLRSILVADLPHAAVAGAGGRVLLRPWQLNQSEYLAHAVDQLRLAAPQHPQVSAALARVLRMLIAHVKEEGRRELVPNLQRQIDLLMEAVETTPGLPHEDVHRLREIAYAAVDPADHGESQGCN